jgi:hypothetical protein
VPITQHRASRDEHLDRQQRYPQRRIEAIDRRDPPCAHHDHGVFNQRGECPVVCHRVDQRVNTSLDISRGLVQGQPGP